MTTRCDKPRVAFQGEGGAFSEEGAITLLGEALELVPHRTLDQLISSGDPSRAARARRRAAKLYGGVILRESIQNSPDNFTRFLLLKSRNNPNSNKGS